MKGSLCPQESSRSEDLNGAKKSAKNEFHDLAKIHNKGRCIFSQTGESRKTKSDGRELKVSFGHNNGLALVY